MLRGSCLTTWLNCTTSTKLLWETAAANKTELCVVTVNLCKKIHPASWNVKKNEMKHFTPSQRVVRASDTAGAAVDECCVLTIPTNHTEVWLLPSTDVFHFHLLSTNLAYTAHLSTHSPPHILYREISIVSSYSCLLYFFVWLESTLRGLLTLRERWSHTHYHPRFLSRICLDMFTVYL